MDPTKFYPQCYNILLTLMSENKAVYFFKPVEPEFDGAKDYYNVIPDPMSFYDIQEKLDNKVYKSPEEFINDMRLIWSNAKYYNHASSDVWKSADFLGKKFEILNQSIPRLVSDGEKYSNLQNYIELRFKRYRMNKTTHL